MQATARQMPTEERNAFFRYIEESQAACQAILKQQPRNRDARYFLGSAYGALAAFAVTIDHDKREAFKQGRQAYQQHLQIVQEQPDYFEQLNAYWASMPADRFPHVAALAEEIGGTGEDEGEIRFAFALDLFITGLAAVTTAGRP